MSITTPPPTRVRRKSFTCTTGIRWTGTRTGELTNEGKPPLSVGPDGSQWSPEDLFVASVNACTMSSFMTLAQKRNIHVQAYESEAVGTLEYVDENFRFTEVVVRPKVVVSDAADIAEVRHALEDAHRSCLIGNSIRGLVLLEPAISFAGDE